MTQQSGNIVRFPRGANGNGRMSRPTLAASIAVFRDGKVLLATRTSPPADRLWSLPGGKVEAGEQLETAALRELDEEVAVKAAIIGFNRHVEIIGRDSHDAVTHHFVVASYVGHWLAGEPQTGPEAGAVMWADPLRLGNLPTTRELGSVLRSAHAIWMEAERRRSGGGGAS